jgi:hypothetical protein
MDSARLAYSDRSAADPEAVKRLYTQEGCLSKLLAEDVPKDTTLDPDALCSVLAPNTVKSKLAIQFLNEFFNLVGDKIPNLQEIHLDPIDKKEVWKEYRQEILQFETEAELLKYSAFCALWDSAFPHVKIREYKAVTGKCVFCATLSKLRCSTKSPMMRFEISDLHVLHKHTYMHERWEYYERTRKAKTDPDNYMSIIMDGMAQNHTKLPWLGNMKEFPESFDQHLQGILEHGQCFTMYRTFNNLTNDANLNIHCLLMQLESRIARTGSLPDTIFIQVDGGSENANKYVLAICELLIHKRLTKNIYFTRLPVGHTHEDIDAKFGMLWKKIRNWHVLTPQSYAEKLHDVFDGNAKCPFELHDIFVVPDYKSFLEKSIDPHFSNWSREELTQHAFKFEAVRRSPEFPMGVKLTYKAYSSDTVYEFVQASEDKMTVTGFIATRVHSFWGPQVHLPDGGVVEGAHVLEKLPFEHLYPALFQPDYLPKVQATLRSIHKQYPPNASGELNPVVKEWEEFFETVYPKSDDPTMFAEQGDGLYVPLLKTLFIFLFSNVQHDDNVPILRHPYTTTYRKAEENPNIIDVMATHSIKFRRNHNLVIKPRYAYPEETTRFGLIDHRIIERQNILETPNDRLDKLKVPELKIIASEYGIVAEGINKNVLIERLVYSIYDSSNFCG